MVVTLKTLSLQLRYQICTYKLYQFSLTGDLVVLLEYGITEHLKHRYPQFQMFFLSSVDFIPTTLYRFSLSFSCTKHTYLNMTFSRESKRNLARIKFPGAIEAFCSPRLPTFSSIFKHPNNDKIK